MTERLTLEIIVPAARKAFDRKRLGAFIGPRGVCYLNKKAHTCCPLGAAMSAELLGSLGTIGNLSYVGDLIKERTIAVYTEERDRVELLQGIHDSWACKQPFAEETVKCAKRVDFNLSAHEWGDEELFNTYLEFLEGQMV